MKIGNFFETRELTPEEIEEYRKLQPGVTITQDMIRAVAVEDGQMTVIEQKADKMVRSHLRVE